jgi:hypothetical protein
MTWMWLAHLDALPGGPPPAAWAEVAETDGTPAGVLAVWPSETRPRARAVKVDGRVVDPEGTAARVSLVTAPDRVRLPFDDTAVQGARRAVLAGRPMRLVSTFLRGDSIFAGAITAAPDSDEGALRDDPFARIFPRWILDVGPGLLGAVPAPAGPVIERYGSGNPWPYDRFGG